ncbi:MAG: hypothetical protein D4R44_08165 [Actinobacteria bacterium]|nr:MAG: hypothetical protein D4R44_08165 [Actinomycetota bacterium]
MAQTLIRQAVQPAWPVVMNPISTNLFADHTVTTTVTVGGLGDFKGLPCYNFRATVNLKTFTVGTTHTAFAIEVADNSAMSTNLRRAAHVVVPLQAGPWSFVMWGVSPDASKLFGRIFVIYGTGASGTFDCSLDAC